MAPTLLSHGKVRHANHKIPEGYTAIEYIKHVMKEKLTNPSRGLVDRVFVIKCDTGSGKSTVMPVELFRLLRNPDLSAGLYMGKSVLCTQPRVLTAKDIAENQVAAAPWNPDMELGQTVGYKTGDFKTSNVDHMLLYATIGSFRQTLNGNTDAEIMSKFKFIIIDEAHERSLDTDLSLMDIKYFYLRNAESNELPILILTSATINEHKYASYFDVGDDNIITVAGFTYPINTEWMEEDVDDILAAVKAAIISLHDENPDDPPDQGSMMVFVPGLGAYAPLKEEIELERDDLLIIFLDRNQVNNQTTDYFYATGKMSLPRGKRRLVIFATNAAETGLTVDSLKYVIDTGWSNVVEKYYPMDAKGLITRPIAVSNALQRRGRCGRKFPGEFRPLYTSASFKRLRKQQFPNIVTEGVENIMLELVLVQQRNKVRLGQVPEFDLNDLQLLDLPPVDSLMLSMDKLVSLGYLSHNALLPLDTDFSNITDDEGEGQRGMGITLLGLVSLGLQRAIPGIEPSAIILHGHIFGNLNTRLLVMLAYVCSSESPRLPKIDPHPQFSELKRVMSCQILESVFMLEWAVKTRFLEKSVLADLATYYNQALDNLDKSTLTLSDEGPSLMDAARDETLFQSVVVSVKRLLALVFRNNIVKAEGEGDDATFTTRHGLNLRMTPPKYFRDSQYYLYTALQIKRGFGNATTYQLKPQKVSALYNMTSADIPGMADTDEAYDPLTEKDAKRLYTYMKLMEI